MYCGPSYLLSIYPVIWMPSGPSCIQQCTRDISKDNYIMHTCSRSRPAISEQEPIERALLGLRMTCASSRITLRQWTPNNVENGLVLFFFFLVPKASPKAGCDCKYQTIRKGISNIDIDPSCSPRIISIKRPDFIRSFQILNYVTIPNNNNNLTISF